MRRFQMVVPKMTKIAKKLECDEGGGLVNGGVKNRDIVHGNNTHSSSDALGIGCESKNEAGIKKNSKHILAVDSAAVKVATTNGLTNGAVVETLVTT